jgi:putative drug exporter of the RND superfamily
MTTFKKLAGLPAGRRTKWITLAAWLIIAFFALGIAPKLSGAESNDSSAYLPSSAESTVALNYINNAPGHPANWAPAVVVYVDSAGITAADQARAAQDAAAYEAKVPGLEGKVSAPALAKGGKALAVEIPILTPNNVDLQPAVKAITAIAQPSGTVDQGALQIYVGGPIAVQNTANGALNGLDGTLLLAAALVVIVVLLLTYRSPFLWFLPVISAFFALELAESVIYELAEHAGVIVSGQSAGILTVLVFGVGTDYALLLIARYREELHQHEDKHEAMAFALRRTSPAVTASALTVMLATLGLLVSELTSNAGLGKIAAIGVACSLLAMLTLLPALLVIAPRWIFWPAKPRYGTPAQKETAVWSRISRLVARRPRTLWLGSAVVLGILTVGLLNLHSGQLSDAQQFVGTPASITAEQVEDQYFPTAGTDPLDVLVDPGAAAQTVDILRHDPGIAPTTAGLTPTTVGSKDLFQVQLAEPAASPAALETVQRLRPELQAVPGSDAMLTGSSAIDVDLQSAGRHDRDLVIPIVLAIAFVILLLLLRSLVAPLLLIGSVVASFAAALGATAFFFQFVLHEHKEDTSYPLYVFIFLVALGIDYNIFLMTRVREESERLGTRPGIVRGVAATGGVITSAGFVLAATFAILASLPLTTFMQIGVSVAFGVLLDTLLVRTILVPALAHDIGPKVWWPSRLSRSDAAPSAPQPAADLQKSNA